MKQFSVDDIVMYGSNGCCLIAAIEERENGQYYILKPVNNDRTKYMVPFDNEDLVGRIRPIPSKRTLKSYIKRASETPVTWIDDSTQRKEAAKEVLAHGNEFDVLVLVRSFTKHKEAVIAAGKKATSADNMILKSAREYIRDEFSVVLGLEPDEADDYIEQNVIAL